MIEFKDKKSLYFELMEHRGEQVRVAIDKSGISKAAVAKKLGIARNTLYYKLDRPDLEYDTIIEIYSIIKRDVTQDFPNLSKFISQQSEEVIKPIAQVDEALSDCQKQLNEYREKYIKLMEEFNQVLKENRALQARQTG